jgi:hypothetical protein
MVKNMKYLMRYHTRMKIRQTYYLLALVFNRIKVAVKESCN